MGKGKPRHNPDKRQNKMGADCPYYEEHHLGVCDGDQARTLEWGAIAFSGQNRDRHPQ